MMSALSMCISQGEQHEMTEFPARRTDGQTEGTVALFD